MDCIFCKIINKKIESFILYEDEYILIILDAFPEADGHILIIPKTHYDTFKEVPIELITHINKYAQIYTDILMQKLNKKGISLVINYGEAQVVKHFHLHLIPDVKSGVKLNKDEVYKLLIGN